MTGDLHAPTVWANTLWATSTLRSNLLLTVGASNNVVIGNRAELHLITPSDNPSDLWMGANNSRRWSITARGSGENYQLGIYNNTRSNWNVIFRDNINDFYVKTQVRDTFLVLPTTGGGYNEGIRIGNASNGWSNIQFGSQNAWNGKVDGQWIIGRNPVKYFQICLAGTETANTSKPGKGISIDINGYLDTGYIRPNIDTEYKATYFYASDDSFIRRTTWDYALNCLNQNQLTLDLSSLDSNKWYPCTINAPAYGGTPLRITIFTGLRGNKPSWASHSSGFSLLLDYYVTGSGWGTLSAVSKLDWYHGSYGGETAFGGRQQNTMGSAEIVYLRGGGVYYYRTTNHGRLTVHPNGYSWANGSYTYSAAVKTSQDNSPIEKTFDQVYWAPANLRTTRNLWGQPFNGSQNVSGAMSGITTLDASSTIYTAGDIVSNSRLFCRSRLYVDRGRYSDTAAPAISLAIGNNDTGLNWHQDGMITFMSNSKAVGHWNYSEGRLYNCYFREPTGNGYAATSMMVNGNGSNLYPGIGFHQPGVTAGIVYFTNSGEFKFRNINDNGYTNVYGGNLIADAGYLYSRYNGIEIKIGAENSSYVHFINNQSKQYYFNNGLAISGTTFPYSDNSYDLGTYSTKWRNIYANRLIGEADKSVFLVTNYIGGQQANPQTYFNNGIGIKVAMTGSIKHWNDTLWINGYSGSDVKDMCALHTVRDGTPQMYISTQKSDATSYGTMYLFYTSYNANKSDRPWICSTLNASSTIYTAGDIVSNSRLFCRSRLYVDRGRYSDTAAPAISLAIGNNDTGLNWHQDGMITFMSNSKAVGHWNYSEGRLYNCYFREPTGNGYAATSMMVNGNGSNLYPGIGFHQPGVTAGIVYFTNSGEFKFRNINDNGYTNVYGGNLIADAGYLYSRYNGIEIKIGAENSSYVHFINNQSKQYYFNNGLAISGTTFPYSDNSYDLGTYSTKWRNIYANRLIGEADKSVFLVTNYIGGQQANPQTYFNNGIGIKVAMTGSIKHWNDTLWINGYSGSDVKDMCALHTVRDGTPQMYISTQKSDATSYGTMYLFYTSYNANKSDRPWICSTLNAYGRITTASDIYSQSWVRTVGTTGWYSESYGGGWHMTDSTWLRAYNNKQIYTASTSPDAFHTLGGVNASGRIYAGSYIETHGGLVCAGVGNSGGASGFNVYGSFYGNASHGGIEIGASDNVLGIGVHSNDSWYIWWTNNGSIGSSSNKSYIFSYNGSSWNFTGSVVASGEVTAYSDARLKSNIHTLDYRGRLIPRHYVKDGKQSIGFIAQEVQTLYPELVLGYDKNRPYLSLNYNGCTAVLSAQLNHVEDEVTMLKNKVRELEIKVSVLTEQLHSQAI